MTDFRKEAEDFASQFVDGEIGRKVFADLVQRFLRSAHERGVEAAHSASVPEDVAYLCRRLREFDGDAPSLALIVSYKLVVDQAADTIEAQAAEIARLKEHVDTTNRQWAEACQTAENYGRELAELRVACPNWQARAEAAEARVAELTKDRDDVEEGFQQLQSLSQRVIKERDEARAQVTALTELLREFDDLRGSLFEKDELARQADEARAQVIELTRERDEVLALLLLQTYLLTPLNFS